MQIRYQNYGFLLVKKKRLKREIARFITVFKKKFYVIKTSWAL